VFTAIHSNSTRHLADALIDDCSRPLADPMQPEVILVQNPGMARWLSQQFALKTGIAANLHFPLPASFVWELQQRWLGEHLPEGGYDRDSLRWWLMRLVPESSGLPECQRLNAYLSSSADDSQVRLYQLSGRIADLFDQYLVYRPELLLGWEQGQNQNQLQNQNQDEAWQAHLWRELVRANGGEHRAQLFQRFVAAADAAPKGPLPDRISVFGLSALAPVYLKALEMLSRHAEVRLYLQNPCREYWADILDERSQAHRRARWRAKGQTDISSLMDLGNPLLAANGQMAQVLVDQLLELDVQSKDLFKTPSAPGLLGQLQKDILELYDARQASIQERRLQRLDDRSIQVHSCHSQLREIQVLHDQLRRAFDELDGLQPQDVVVMAPNITDYAPWIEAIFASASGKNATPWSVADTSQTQSPLYRAIDSLLRLPRSRFEASALIELLEVPAVMARFNLDTAALEQIRHWVSDSGIRWGWDGAMRQSLGLPEETANTWDLGLQRLFYGYALPLGAGLCQDILPYGNIEGSEAEHLGQLAEFLERLRHWRDTLAQPAPAEHWQQRINQLLTDLFRPSPEDEPLLQGLRNAMAELVHKARYADYQGPIELDIIRSELGASLDQHSSASGFLIGRITFCNLVPMRGIPFRVVCLLGLNEGEFPRHDPSPGFNLMAARARLGDRSRRLDDRYLFLEALLAAQERLLFFYQGRSAKDNASQPPSVVLSELLDYLKTSYGTAQDSDITQQLLTEHPLQPFSRRYYDGSDPGLFSYDDHWLAAIKDQPEAMTEPAGARPRPTRATESIALNDLIRFLQDPPGWFLRQGLGARKADEALILQDTEAFELESLSQYGYKSEIVQALLDGQALEDIALRAQLSGELPPGNLGRLKFTQLSQAMADLTETIRQAINGQSPQALEIDLILDNTRINGWLHNLYPSGLIAWRPSRIKAKDHLALWVRHLALCLTLAPTSQLIMENSLLSFHPLKEDDARALLQGLIDLWHQGQARPLPLFPAASLAYIEALDKGNTEAEAISKAQDTWEKDDYGTGKSSLAVASLFQNQDPISEPEFAQLARLVFEPILKHQSS
jgi:exodeoxyribonuclease V gamma subunit